MITTLLNKNFQYQCVECNWLNTPNEYAINAMQLGNMIVRTCSGGNCDKSQALLIK